MSDLAWERLRLLREAEKACEFQVNDCLFWINEYRRSGREPHDWRVAKYLETVRWLSRWREELAELEAQNGSA